MDCHPSKDAGVDAHLKVIDLIAAPNPSWESLKAAFQQDKEKSGGPEAIDYVVDCPEAYYNGVVSCQRLLDVVVSPFLKLGQYINREARLPVVTISSEYKDLLDMRVDGFRVWAGALWRLAS